jgi:cytochrome P450
MAKFKARQHGTRLRAPLNRQFTPQAVAHLTADIDEIACDLL